MQSKLNKQVANKELSKKLEELGVKIDTIFYHDYLPGGADGTHTEQEFKLLNGDLSDHAIPALTSSELGEMLPKKVKDNYSFILYNNSEYLKENDYEESEKWSCGYQKHELGWCQCGYEEKTKLIWRGWLYWETSETMVDAMVKMLIYLIEQGLVKVDDINKQLN